jgi:alpha-mannosidase
MLARGRLVDREAKTSANFAQTTRLRRGSRVIELDIEIEPERFPTGNPWDSYYAARFAWNDSTADIFRDVNSTSQQTEADLLEAPRFVDILSEKIRTTILSGGLPYHRRFGLRKLDTLLIVKGETARRFRLGIGLDLPQPVAAAIDFLSPEIEVNEVAAPQNPSGWLFHIDARNVVATAWEPLEEDSRLVGFTTRVLETEGRNTRCHLSCFRPPVHAEMTDFLGGDRDDLDVEKDRITIDIAAHEWLQVEARWARDEQ